MKLTSYGPSAKFSGITSIVNKVGTPLTEIVTVAGNVGPAVSLLSSETANFSVCLALRVTITVLCWPLNKDTGGYSKNGIRKYIFATDRQATYNTLTSCYSAEVS